jgi:hypothetical protein
VFFVLENFEQKQGGKFMRLPKQVPPVIRYESSSINRGMAFGIKASAWCTCTEDGYVDINKCGTTMKPKCDGDSCDCVQK